MVPSSQEWFGHLVSGQRFFQWMVVDLDELGYRGLLVGSRSAPVSEHVTLGAVSEPELRPLDGVLVRSGR